MNNRAWNAKNPHQGDAKKVLVVCSAGLLRSPTIAHMLAAPPYNFNTRAVGVDAGHALIPLDDVLIHWADEIIFVSPEVADTAQMIFIAELEDKTTITLQISDNYAYGSPELKQVAEEQLRQEYLY